MTTEDEARMNAGTAYPDEVLVVDDASESLKLLEEILTVAGYRVRLANDGELALRSARIKPPAMVLLDIRMPGMDGYAVCRRLKEDDRTSGIPVIFISILEDEHDKVKGFRAGAVDFITKPFQPDEVLARIQTHLRLRELTEELEQKIAERTAELTIVNERLRQEVTERKRAEENLLRMNERFVLASRAAGLGVWDWDIRKNELAWDDRMYALYGVRREDSVGAYEAWLAEVHPDDRARCDEISKLARQGEGEYDTEFRVVWPDGAIRYLKAYGLVVRDADGEPVRMTGINIDITARQAADAALQRLKEELEQRVRERTAELEVKNAELEQMNQFFVGRELRMVELKERIKELEREKQRSGQGNNG